MLLLSLLVGAVGTERSHAQMERITSNWQPIDELLLDQVTSSDLLLSSGWRLQVLETEDGKGWERNAIIPSAWEDQLGINFDGKAIYTRVVSLQESNQLKHRWSPVSASAQLVLQLEGVATKAEVFCNGQLVGQHVGAWTPWDCDLTNHWDWSAENKLEIRVDELVDHHTQGFLPIVAPHFGGIWKSVSLRLVPRTRILPRQSMVLGSAKDGKACFQFRIKTSQPLDAKQKLRVWIPPANRLRLNWDSESGNVLGQRLQAVSGYQKIVVDKGNWKQVYDEIHFEIPVADAKLWSCEEPWLYDVSVEIVDGPEIAESNLEEPSSEALGLGSSLSKTTFRTGIRDVRTDGHRLLLNGKPIQVRGILNWGYSPPSTAPSLSVKDMLAELRILREMKMNLMKFCLYLPPQEYLELCDMLGVMAWMEYPTWHAQLVPENLNALSREYREFTDYDRNHPSVILRSLTCETGSSADLEVLRTLFEQVHDQVPGSVVEDDSSWISWNRISDFWDDHPYGNNHDWVATLDRLKQYIAQHEDKPLILGEAIAADTWPDLDQLGKSQRYPQPLQYGFTQSARSYEAQLAMHFGEPMKQQLIHDSIRYALLMRKYQLETYRREVPMGGAVVSVIRDFPLASMGLLDQNGLYKFQPNENLTANRSQARLLAERLEAPEYGIAIETQNDRRSFPVGAETPVTVFLLAPDPESIKEVSGTIEVWSAGVSIHTVEFQLQQKGAEASLNSSSLHWQSKLDLPTPNTVGRYQVVVRLEATTDKPENQVVVKTQNAWDFWAVPTIAAGSGNRVRLHPSVANDQEIAKWLSGSGAELAEQPWHEMSTDIVISRHWDRRLLQQLEAGQRVLMLPDGKKNSFVVGNHWFLRGGPVVSPTWNWGMTHDELPIRDLLVELQHFDLAGPVHKDFQFWNESSPLLMLWDNHDIDVVKTHGLVWAAKIGKGRLLVSTLNHSDERSSAGPFLLQRFINQLRGSASDQWKQWPSQLVDRLKSELQTTEMNLVEQDWRLARDPDQAGREKKWHLPETSTEQWKSIRIDRHWEGQGFSDLDGWAWYDCEVEIPKEWDASELYLCFTGVDDHYRAYVNGVEVGSAGNIETKETAFELRSSYRLPQDFKAGDRLTIRIAVYDWYGSGGIFRPVFLRTQPLSETPPILQR